MLCARVPLVCLKCTRARRMKVCVSFFLCVFRSMFTCAYNLGRSRIFTKAKLTISDRAKKKGACCFEWNGIDSSECARCLCGECVSSIFAQTLYAFIYLVLFCLFEFSTQGELNGPSIEPSTKLSLRVHCGRKYVRDVLRVEMNDQFQGCRRTCMQANRHRHTTHTDRLTTDRRKSEIQL